MPAFLEKKLKEQYGQNSSVPYKIMNAKGYMEGNKETEAGKEAQRKHNREHTGKFRRKDVQSGGTGKYGE